MEDYNLIKSCCFYVSSTHLTTMILPHIKESIEKNKKIITFFEYNLKNNIEILLSKVNLEENVENDIKNINWKHTNTLKYSNIEKILKEFLKEKIEILICGSNNYINLTNEMIEKYINKNIKKYSSKKIKIVNCYQVEEFNENVREILEKHVYYLNTAGEQKIENVFGEILQKEHID